MALTGSCYCGETAFVIGWRVSAKATRWTMVEVAVARIADQFASAWAIAE
jgi:hypothetical protein